MKRGFLSFLVTAVLVSFAAGCTDKGPAEQVECSGRVKTATHAIERQYSGIKVSDSIKVTVTDRVKHVTVSCDKRVLPYVILAVKNNVLNIGYEEIDIIGDPQTEILVPASAELCYIYGIASARISTEVPVAAEEVSVRGTSNAVLDITVDTRKCRVDINNGATLTLSGKAYDCHVEAATGAVFNGEKLDAENFSSLSNGKTAINR